MGHPEWTDKILSSYPTVDLNMEGVETEGQKEVVWESSEGNRRIDYVVAGGGDWVDTWTKVLTLSCTDKLVPYEMMRVEITKNTTNGEITKTVFIDVFKFDGGKGKTASFAYSVENGGKIEEIGRIVERSQGEIEDYFETLKTENIRTLPDLPDRIDVEETIRLFAEQIEERRLGLPVLIPA